MSGIMVFPPRIEAPVQLIHVRQVVGAGAQVAGRALGRVPGRRVAPLLRACQPLALALQSSAGPHPAKCMQQAQTVSFHLHQALTAYTKNLAGFKPVSARLQRHGRHKLGRRGAAPGVQPRLDVQLHMRMSS